MQAAARRRRIRNLGLAFAGLIAAVLVVATIVWVNVDLIQRAGRDVGEAQSELTWADAAIDAANDQQNALAGVVATHDPRYVFPFEQGRQRFDHAFARLTAYSLDDPADQRRAVVAAGRLAQIWTDSVAGPQVAATKAGLRLPPPSRTALEEMSQVADRIDDVRDHESRLLAQRERVLSGAYGATRMAMAVGSTAALAFILVILSLAARQLINDRRRAEDSARSLTDALQRAQAAERTKTRFLANMSHEMRTPLNGVTGMTEALSHTKLDLMQRELVDAILFSSATLDHLIGDLIRVSRDGVASSVEHQAKTFRLGAAIRAIALPFGAEAKAKGLAFIVEVEAAADIQVTGDPGALGELLACLLSNAIKFTARGQIRVTVRRLGEATFGIQVSDTGTGFDEAAKARMFETFNQEDDSETRRFGGAGLGLAVARRLAEELRGVLDVHSTPGVGSVFSLEIGLPAAGGDQPTQALATATAGEEDEPLRVLIVDDGATNRKVLELILDQVGVEWISVEDGLQAVDAARREAFAAILMDIQMPVMDGLTATREIRRIELEASRPATPVIIVSASCQPEHIEAGVAAGAQRHLGKPVSAQALIDALNEVLADLPQAA
jgi:signal transduction histidine kinase/ActR/RegA family two-component response regulator